MISVLRAAEGSSDEEEDEEEGEEGEESDEGDEAEEGEEGIPMDGDPGAAFRHAMIQVGPRARAGCA